MEAPALALSGSMVLLGELAAIGSAFVWVIANVFYVRLAAERSPLVLNALKCLLALGLLALTLLALEGAIWPPGISTGALVGLAVSGVVGVTLGDTLYFAALERIGARRGVLLSSLVPPIAAFVAWVGFGESLTLAKLGGMALTLGGVAIVMRERLGGADGEDAGRVRSGLLFGLGAVLCQVTANILTKEAGESLSALGISVVRLAFGTLALIPWVALRGRWPDVIRAVDSRRTAGLLLLATFLGTYLGIWLYMAGIHYAEVGVALTLSATGPIFVLPFAHYGLGEPWTPRSVAGAIVATAGVALLFVV